MAGFPLGFPMGLMPMPMMPVLANPFLAGAAMARSAAIAGAIATVKPSKSSSSSSIGVEVKAKEKERKEEPDLDPAVQRLCDHFQIEERWIKRLDSLIARRGSKDRDLAKLYEILENARSPTGLLVAKIGEMECGQFTAKVKPDRNMQKLACRFSLDERVVCQMTELRIRRKRTKDEDFRRLEQHLQLSKRPSATASRLIRKLLDGRLPRLPDVTGAEVIARRFKLDASARARLRKVVEVCGDDTDVFAKLEKELQASQTPSARFPKIARSLIRAARSSHGRHQSSSESSSDSSCSSRSRSRSRARRGSRTRSQNTSRTRARNCDIRNCASRTDGQASKQIPEQSRPVLTGGPAMRPPAPVQAGAVHVGSGVSGWTSMER